MVIQINEVSKIYHAKEEVEFFALKDISFQVQEGDFVTIVGPSGAGKTTLFNLIGTLDTPSYGQILIQGKSTKEMNLAEKVKMRNRVIGFIFQNYRLIPNMTAFENALLPLLVSDKRYPQGKEKDIVEAFEKYNLANCMKKYPGQLSGGEQQRVAIIRALANDPDIVLADEPTGSLDSEMSEYVFKLLQQINSEKGKTVIYITHNRELVEKAKRIISIKDGRLINNEINCS